MGQTDKKKSWLKQITAHVRPLLMGRAILAAVVIALGIFYLRDQITTSQVGVLSGLVAALLLGIFISEEFLKSFPSRIGKISIGSFSLDLQAAQQAAASSATDEDDAEDQKDHESVDSFYKLKIKLEYKIADLAYRVPLNPDGAQPGSFVNIGSLRHDNLLNDAQARTAYTIIALGSGGPVDSTGRTDSKILDAADSFVSNFRATVFHALVLKIIKNVDPACGEAKKWNRFAIVTKATGEPGRLIVPIYTETADNKVVQGLVDRSKPQDASEVIIVTVRGVVRERTEKIPAVWTLDRLREQLEANNPNASRL